MLFHRMLGHDSGVEIFHIVGTLEEELDSAAFRRAWQRIVDRYAIYRTGFRWRDCETPVQEVYGDASLEWREEDWRGRSPADQEGSLESFLLADRGRGIDLERPPLIRMALFRRAEASWSFVWTMYHGVVDGRSVRALLIEVFAAYEAFRQGEQPTAPTVEPFRRYIEWLDRQDMVAADAYWRRLLAGFRAPTPLGLAKVARRLQAAREPHSDREIHLPEAATAALEGLCAACGITLHTLVQAAWALLLGRYGSADDVVFGCVKSNRAAVPKGKRIIGPLINTLIMRVRTPPELCLEDLLMQVRAQWLAHRAHEFVPLGKIQQWSEIPAEARLFESIVVFENYRWNESLRALGGAWGHRWLRVRRQPEYPLTLYGFKAERLALKLIYDRRAFDTSMILRMLGHLERILLAVVEAPGRRLDEVEILSPAERSQLLVQWNDTRARMDAPPVHESFQARAQERPDAQAVRDGELLLSYAELNRRANRWARFLIASGVGPEVPVALCLRRSAALVTATLAVLKAGGAYVPLDPAQPPKRLALMLEELGWPLLLTHGDLLPGFQELGSRVVDLAAEPPGRPAWEDSNPRLSTWPGQLAYLIYTSGSTGRPKGVAVTHHSLSNLVAWRDTLAVSSGDRGALIVNPAFDPWMWELWPYLTAGASVQVPPEELLLSPVEMRDWLIEHAVTGCVLPTPVAELLLNLEWPRMPALRRLLVGGDRLSGRPAPEVEFLTFNNYGPAECTVVATSGRVEARSVDPRPPAIGRPMTNVEVYLLDQHGLPVPVGVVGEVFLGGEGLARGYWGRPGETAGRFIPDPLSGAPGERLYRTGDLARYDFTGQLHFFGRTDHQVKIRGNRVELGEIEANLLQHPALRDAIVVLKEQGQQWHLVAYVSTLSLERGASSPDLRHFLRQRLPAYMVPAAFVVLERLPRTPHGKVDRQALPVPQDLFVADRAFAPPTTSTEVAVAEVWRQVLGLDRVGLDDNFYEVGGHSLALIRTRETLRLRFDLDLKMIDLMENPTVRLQAEHLSRAAARGIECQPTTTDLPTVAEPG